MPELSGYCEFLQFVRNGERLAELASPHGRLRFLRDGDCSASARFAMSFLLIEPIRLFEFAQCFPNRFYFLYVDDAE
jgi:hypothetical protein